MTALAGFFTELLGLFVEDGALALAIIAVVALAGISAALVPNYPLATAAILVFGCLGVLFFNTLSARRR